jgi:hypothetical protein
MPQRSKRLRVPCPGEHTYSGVSHVNEYAAETELTSWTSRAAERVLGSNSCRP